MDVEEVKDKKLELVNNIDKLLSEFYDETGVRVEILKVQIVDRADGTYYNSFEVNLTPI